MSVIWKELKLIFLIIHGGSDTIVGV